MAEMSLSKKAGGMPVWVWIVGGAVFVGGAWFLIRKRQAAANTASQNATAATTAATTVPATSGDFSTDQAQAIFADIRDLQGQESQFAGTASNLSNQITSTGTSLGNQITGVGQQVAKIPAGPPGPAGTPGTQGNPGPPGPPPAPPPPPPVRPPPAYHEAVVHTDGRRSLQFYASEYGTSMANILAATRRSEPSDYNSASSKLHKYITKGQWANVVPAGYTLYVPYVR